MPTQDAPLLAPDGAANMVHGALRAGALLLAALATYYLYRGYVVRSRFQRLQRQGVPMMPHHPIFGHLGNVGRLVAAKLPTDAHGHYLGVLIQEHWRELFVPAERYGPAGMPPPAVYLDMWPFSPPFLVSLHGDVTAQFTQDFSMDHPPEQRKLLMPLTGGYDVTSSNGELWAARRKAMSPVFSPANIAAHTPAMVDEVAIFLGKLKARAGKDGAWGGVFPLQDLATRLTLDVIYKLCVGVRVGDQDGDAATPVSASLVSQIGLLRFRTEITNFLEVYSPMRGWRLWRNSRTMNSFLLPLIRDRFARGESGQTATDSKGKTLIDVLAKQQENQSAAARRDTMMQALGEIKHTLFAGHETTSFSMCTVLNRLAQHPDALARVRAEVDEVFGAPKSEAENKDDPMGLNMVLEQIRESPHLLNRLVYTTAVIKETMRIDSNVGTLRIGRPGFNLYGPPTSGPYHGVEFPTEGFVLMDSNFAIHRGSFGGVWGEQPLAFAPERWLPSGGDDDNGDQGGGNTNQQYPPPPRNAYRPFEHGPRNCVGQHLAMAEIRLVTALVVRELDVECAWDEWDELMGNNDASRKPAVWGSRLYQTGKHATPHLKDGMPVHVRLRSDGR